MPKSLEQTKAALKLRSTPKSGALTLRLGLRKYVLPFEVRMIQSDDHIFVHVPPSAEIMKFADDGLVVIDNPAEAEKIAGTLKKTRKRSARGQTKAAELPAELASVLSKLPAGFRLGYDANGQPKLVKTRRRRKK